jgi:hypothetical protein
MPRHLAQTPDHSSDAALVRLQAGIRYFFAPAEFARQTGRQPGTPAVRLALHRLAQRGRIVAVTRRPSGYLILPPEHISFGAPPVTWWIDDCLRRIEPNYYVGLLSAAHHWGSSHYARQDTQVMLSRVHPPLTPGRLRVVFHAKKQLATTPTEIVRNDVVPWRVSTRSATLLDLLRHQTAVGGLETVARVTRDLSSAIDKGELVTALDALDQAPAGQRLGFVFQCLGYDTLANHVFKWVARRRHSVRQPLELGVPTREQTTIDRRWNISFNSRRVTALEEIR